MGAPLLKGVALLGVRFEIWTSSSLFPLVLVLDRWQANRCSQRRQCSSFGYSSAIAEYRTCFIVFFFSGNRRVGLVQQTGFCNWRESMKWTSFSVSIAPLFSRRRQGTAVSFGFSAVEGGRFPAVGG